MIWSLIGLFLMGVGFPKCWLTERRWPRPSAPKVHQPDRSWTHNCKDDFTDDITGDKEWWVKFLGFVIIVLLTTTGVLIIW